MAKLSLGEFLAVLRKAKGLTQEEVAEKLGVSSKSISSWENNRTYPDILLLPALADLYGVSVDEIIRGERVTREGTDAQANEINEAAMKKLRIRKYVQYRQKRSAAIAIAVAGAFLSCLFFVAKIVTLIFGILGIVGFVVGLALLVTQTKSYLVSEGIAFREDVSEQNSRFYLSVVHGAVTSVIGCFLPYCFLDLIIFGKYLLSFLWGFDGAMNTGFMLFVILFAIPLAAIAGVLLWQRQLVKAYGTEEQKNGNIGNRKLLALLAAVWIVVVAVANGVVFGVLKNSLHEVKPVDSFVYSNENDFIGHVQTLRVETDTLRYLGIQNGDTFLVDLSEFMADRNEVQRNGVSAEPYSKVYDIDDHFRLLYVNIGGDSEGIFVYYQDGQDENNRYLVKKVQFVTVYGDAESKEENGSRSETLALNLYYDEANEEEGYSAVTIGTPLAERKVGYKFEAINGDYALYRYEDTTISARQLNVCIGIGALLIEAILYLILRKKTKFPVTQETF